MNHVDHCVHHTCRKVTEKIKDESLERSKDFIRSYMKNAKWRGIHCNVCGENVINNTLHCSEECAAKESENLYPPSTGFLKKAMTQHRAERI